MVSPTEDVLVAAPLPERAAWLAERLEITVAEARRAIVARDDRSLALNTSSVATRDAR